VVGGVLSVHMRKATRIYVVFIIALTLVAIAGLAAGGPSPSADHLYAVVVLGAFATCAEMLAFVLARNQVVGSVAFIPFLATVLVSPSWVAVGCGATFKLLVEAFRRGRGNLIKAIFNACTHGLAIASAIGVYLSLGGEGLLSHRSREILSLSGSFGLPAFFAFLAAFIINTLVVVGVFALESRESIWSVLPRKLSISGIGGDLLTAPVVFVLAWLYSAYGPMLAGAAFLPIVGLTQLNRVQMELEETNQELLQLMVKSIEARDPYTSGHSRRVSKYAASIAKSLGLSQREIDAIATAALLHDVGKIYEKYAPILRNPGRLTPEEWTTMQEHPVDGANLVSTISRLKTLVPAVRHHHENWDGTGYPDKIAGEAIPLASRIIMFADTIDAMTSERPYRGPLSEPDVRAEIVRGRGRQFDPVIADRLLAAGVWKTLFASEKAAGRGLTLIADRETA
jgi:putative nucleotidyltransferase with HDIG domain